MAKKIGFYICHCGTNIGGKVRVQEVARFIEGLKGVVVARDYKFMCSDPGQEMIQKDIRELGLNRIVVASCSPRLHEKTFQSACKRAGLNPYFFQMACVREHCSWVVADPNDATLKAKALASAAIHRVARHQSLPSKEARVHPDVLVVGAGIAGIQASLDIARAGFKVHLVEKEPSIGGHMVQFDKTFPTLDCAACISTPKTVAVAQNPNINLLSYSEVVEVKGFIGNYTARILRKPRYVREDRCTGCGLCAEVCPVSIPNQFDEFLSQRKAVYRFFPQAAPITFAIEKKDRAPCVTSCPARVNVQGYVQLIGQGKYEEALQIIMEKIPLPGVLGRVCPHPCESACRRQEVDEAIAIRDLKRIAADHFDIKKLPAPTIEEKDEKVAVIGSGPAGLTVAHDLRLLGYKVTIFEGLPAPGGMLRVGIPDYRLPPELLDLEISNILRMDVELRTGLWLGSDFSLADLRHQDFKAIFIGIGAHRSLKLNIRGANETAGVLDAVDFLREVNLGLRKMVSGRRAVVVGGGNVAIDAARTALRLGCEEVSIVYRRTMEDMPAYREEIEDALTEGIKILCLSAPIEVVTNGDGGGIAGLECIRTEPGEPDASGRRRPVPVQNSEFLIPCEAVIAAIGQEPDGSCLSNSGIEQTKRNTIAVDLQTMRTSAPDVFAAGDAVSGPATVIEAIASAHRAAEAIHRFLQGENVQDVVETPAQKETMGWRDIPKGLRREHRAHTKHLETTTAVTSFSETSLGLDEEEARREALRCLNCGVCSECKACVQVCERNAIDHSMKSEEIEIDVGSIVVATGFDIMDPSSLSQYGYGRYSEVYTGLEFERLNNAVGPTGGRIVMKDGQVPSSIGIIHCVGSRDVNHHSYCSRVCCMYALKYGHLIKERLGHHTDVYNFYIDMRCFGKGYEEFYRRLQEEGVTFIRGRPGEVTDLPLVPEEIGKLMVIVEDTLLGRRLRVPVDMLILCSAMEPRKSAAETARVFGISQGSDGFFLEEHPKLGPMSTATDGVFLAGTCQGPKDIPDAVAHASGAAAQALALAARGKVEVSSTTSWINSDICAGCQTCIKLCAYSAIEFDQRRGVAVVNEAVCKGCGSCSGFCPSGAASSKHFNTRQVFAEIEGMLDDVI